MEVIDGILGPAATLSLKLLFILDREDCVCIVIYEGAVSVKSRNGLNPEYKKHFAVLLGGTRNGHVLMYDRNGNVRRRFQLHSACIFKMIADNKRQLLLTTSKGEKGRQKLKTQ